MEKIIKPLCVLGVRYYIANMTLQSGIEHLNNFNQFEMVLRYNHGFFVSPHIDALIIVGAELICSTLIIAGLMTRYMATILIIMSLIISEGTILQFILNQPLLIQDKHLWFCALILLIIFGAGKLSLDYYIKDKILDMYD